MFEQQAKHIAYIISEAVKRERDDRRAEPGGSRRLGQAPSENSRSTTSAFELSCTPGYYNNEGGGGGEGIRSFLGEFYSPGFYAFDDLLKEWRDKGDLDGLVLGK